jgi:hypothetical protein
MPIGDTAGISPAKDLILQDYGKRIDVLVEHPGKGGGLASFIDFPAQAPGIGQHQVWRT